MADLTGQRYGRLVVYRQVEDYVAPDGHRHLRWLCECDCGVSTVVRTEHLVNGDTISCGCWRRETGARMMGRLRAGQRRLTV